MIILLNKLRLQRLRNQALGKMSLIEGDSSPAK